ncbi:MAG: hypothetical protein H6Q84_2736 [Deltaproteobacteria bacterium]|nr:hypothetical protein [Deltaproteobacteria bacterium]
MERMGVPVFINLIYRKGPWNTLLKLTHYRPCIPLGETPVSPTHSNVPANEFFEGAIDGITSEWEEESFYYLVGLERFLSSFATCSAEP